MGAIAANTFFLAAEHWQANNAWVMAQEAAEWVFNIIFFVEMILKIVCLKGFDKYWLSLPNRFDFVIVMSSLLQIIIDLTMSAQEADKLAILKLFRLHHGQYQKVSGIHHLMKLFKLIQILE